MTVTVNLQFASIAEAISALSRLSGDFAQTMARLESEIHEAAGEPFNLGSPKQLGDILFGNWADLLIGMWGGLDLMVDPYTGSTAGTVRVVALQDVDVAIRHAESFATMVDAITA